MINVPEKYREEFDKSADFAIIKGKFTPGELAEFLETSELVASIMIGYMEKAGLITKGKNDDVRSARITLEEWEQLGKRIENYQPLPEPEPEAFEQATEQEPEITLDDLIDDGLVFIKKKLGTGEGYITVTEADCVTAIAFEDIATVFLHKGGLFTKSAITFSSDSMIPQSPKLRADTLLFANKDYKKIKNIAEAIASRLGISLTEY